MQTVGRSAKAALALCAALLLSIYGAHAQPRPKYTEVLAESLTDAPFHLSAAWISGVLRVGIVNPPARWTIELDYGPAGKIRIDEASVAPRIAFRELDRLVVDIPVVPNAVLRARTNVEGLKVIPLLAITPSSFRPEQMIVSSSVASLNGDSLGSHQSIAEAFARADVLSVKGAVLGVCTAFRVAKNYWLTAAHCAFRLKGQVAAQPIGALRLQTGAYAGKVDAAAPLIAKATFAGIASLPITEESFLSTQDLDYALLFAEGDPGGPSITLTSAVAPPPLTLLSLYQYWAGELDPPAGKAVSEGPSCTVKIRFGANDPSAPELCPFAIQHGCSSQTGTSGSPIVNRASLELVGLHYGAGLPGMFNCGIPSATIRSDICKRAPETARKAIQCQ